MNKNGKLYALILAIVFLLAQTTTVFAMSHGTSGSKYLTRSQFIVMLHKTLDIQIRYVKAPDIKEYYSDVEDSAPYAVMLYDLATLGIVDFQEEFLPNKAITKEEMVHMVMAGYKNKLGDRFMVMKLAHKAYRDESKLNPSYQGDMVQAEYLKLVTRTKNNMIQPKSKVTKTQANTMLAKLERLIEKEEPRINVTPSFQRTAEGLVMKLTLLNASKGDSVLHHTSGQKYDFQIMDAQDQVLYTWSADKSFIMAETETVLKAGEEVIFSERISLEDAKSFLDKVSYMKGYVICRDNPHGIVETGYMAALQQ